MICSRCYDVAYVLQMDLPARSKQAPRRLVEKICLRCAKSLSSLAPGSCNMAPNRRCGRCAGIHQKCDPVSDGAEMTWRGIDVLLGSPDECEKIKSSFDYPAQDPLHYQSRSGAHYRAQRQRQALGKTGGRR